jgi:hypothetical protein
MGVVCFFSPIFSYFCLFVAALRPCQGKLPRRKYIKTCPSDSRSSRLDCSVNKWLRIQVILNRKKKTHLGPSECLYSCIALSHSNSCVPGKGYAALFSDRGIAWPCQSRRRVRLLSSQLINIHRVRYTERCIRLAALVAGRPTRKLSGLMSR